MTLTLLLACESGAVQPYNSTTASSLREMDHVGTWQRWHSQVIRYHDRYRLVIVRTERWLRGCCVDHRTSTDREMTALCAQPHMAHALIFHCDSNQYARRTRHTDHRRHKRILSTSSTSSITLLSNPSAPRSAQQQSTRHTWCPTVSPSRTNVVFWFSDTVCALIIFVAMSLAVPPPFARMASKRASNIDSSPSTSSIPPPSAYSSTAAASLNLTPPSIRPPPTQSLQHATLTTLTNYHTHTLTPTAFSTTTPPTYHPRSTTPLPPSAFTHTIDSPSANGTNQSDTKGKSTTAADTALLDSLLDGNRAREAADRRLRLDVAERVSRWSHDVALQGERAVQQMDAIHNQRVNNGNTQQQPASKTSEHEEQKEETITLGYTLQGNDKLAWKQKELSSQLPNEPIKKLSKKDKDKEELEKRMRDMSLAYSPQSVPPSSSYLDVLLAASGGGYVGSALGVSLSAFRGSEPLVVSEAACEMLSSSAVLPAVQSQSTTGASSVSAVAATPAATSADPSRSTVGAIAGSPFPTASALHAEVNRVKACVAAAGVYVHAGAVERALGSGRAVAGTTLTSSGSVWPVPFSGLVDDPKDKKKRAAGDKKTAVKKAAKRK